MPVSTNVPRVAHGGPPPREPRARAASIGLWVFMGVATSLFLLFAWAYVMRMSEGDAVPLALPQQLLLSTALLLAGSVSLELAHGVARECDLVPTASNVGRAHRLLLAGGLCALAFLASQLWAWHALLSARVMPTSHPAGSFFYVLTAMHGLHLAGGLIGWAWTAYLAWRQPAVGAWRIGLVARYWHFMLAVWLGLYALLHWMTPEAARFICGVG
ncbi:MAG: bb3-type cytochrome oxidase subunit III [Proteobacteria bacterium]|nr:bb3-type cytochrome oxidase subunit III [Pseudomonadota bacterium]